MRHGKTMRRGHSRKLAMVAEPVERRMMLTVTPAEYASIRSIYPEFGLPSDMAQIVIHEITPDQLSLANLKTQITSAGTTTLPDLIVLRTTGSSNTINLQSNSDTLSIDIPAANGALTIVAQGTTPLKVSPAAPNYPTAFNIGSTGSTTSLNLGGMVLGGTVLNGGTLRMVDVGNDATVLYSGGTAAYGGTLFARKSTFCKISQYGATSTLNDVAFTLFDTYTNSGGGLYLSGGSATINNATFSPDSEASVNAIFGGAIYATHAILTITNSVLSGHTDAGGYGGAIYSEYSTVKLTNVTIKSSIAMLGGGLFVAAGSATLTNVAIYGCSAPGSVGSIDTGTALYLSSCTALLGNVTVAGNWPIGHAVYLNGSTAFTAYNTIIAANLGYDLATSPNFSGTITAANDLIGNGSDQSVIVNGVNGNLVGTAAGPLDPRLANTDLGSVQPESLRPLPTSPAVNAGNNAWIPAGTTTDLQGGPRIIGGTVDMGAYEYGPPLVIGFQVNDGSAQRSMVNKLVVTFSNPVTIATGAFSLLKRNGSAVPDVALTVTNPSGDQVTWQVAFSGSPVINSSLPDGTYKLLINAAGVIDTGGTAMAANYIGRFHRLFGDSDGDRMVDRSDLVAMRNVLTMHATASWFDYDGNGTIDVSDWRQLKLRQRRALV